MPRKFNPEGVPVPAFYSHGVEIEAGARMVFVSGQVGVRPDGTPGAGIGEQTSIAMDNVKSVLAAAGMGVEDVVKTTIYLTDEANFEGFAGAGASMLASPPAATTLVYVKALASPVLLVEIDVIAAK